MKNFTQVVNEGLLDSKPFSIFGLLFGSSHDKDDEVSKAKKKAREDMAKKKAQAKEELKKKKKSIKAKLIEAKANFKMNQFNIKQKQKADALERRLRQMTKLASMYDRNSSEGILQNENGMEAFQKMLNNVKNGLPEDHIDDMEYIQAKITKCLFKKDDDGNITMSSPNEIQNALNELVSGNNSDPKIKDIMKKHGLVDDNGNIKEVDDETQKQLLSDFAGYSSDYENADKDLENAETIYNELKIKKEKLEKAESTREKLNKISKSLEEYNSIPNVAADITDTDQIPKSADKPWDEVKDELTKHGVTKEIYENLKDKIGTEEGQFLTLKDALNSTDPNIKGKRTEELKKQKEKLKNDIQSEATEAGLSLDSDDFNDNTELEEKIEERRKAIDKTLTDANIPEGTTMEIIETALTEAEKSVKACQERIEERNEQSSQLRATYEAAEEVEKKHGIQNNEDVKKIRAEIENESWNGGEVEQDGKKGVEYIDKDGKKQFMPRPEPGSKDEKLYQQRLKLAVLQQQEDLSQPLEVVEPVIESGKLKNEKEYKEYLQAKAKREAAESQMEKIRTEIQTAAKNAKDGKEITSEQKELLQAVVNSFPDDYSKMTEDQQAMLASLSMTPPKDPKADDEVEVEVDGNTTTKKMKWSELDDEQKESYRQKLRAKEEEKHKERLKKLGLSDDQIEKAQKLSKKEKPSSSTSDKTPSSSTSDETPSIDDITADDFEDGFEIKDKDGLKYVKQNGEFWMQDEHGNKERYENFDDWLKEVEKNTDFDPADLEDMEDEAEDEEGKKKQDPRKVWKQKTYKRGQKTFRTKSYYNKKGNSISKEDFDKKVEAFETYKRQQTPQGESLSIYLQKKLLLG